MPQLDTSTFTSQIFWLVVTFLLLFAVVRGVAAPRLTGMAAARAGQRDGDFAAAEAARAQEKARDDAFHAEIAAAHAQARSAVDGATMASRAATAASLAALGDQLKARGIAAAADLGTTRGTAERELRDAADATARDLVHRLTGIAA